MALTDAATIESDLSVSAAVAAKAATHCLEAGLYLVRLKGQAWYTERVGWHEAGANATADQQALLRLASRAESVLALYYALPLLNAKVADEGGVVVTEWETDADGTRRQTAFAAPEAIAATRRELLRQAHLLTGGDVRLGYSSDSTLIDTAQTSNEVTLVEGETGSFVISSVEDDYR